MFLKIIKDAIFNEKKTYVALKTGCSYDNRLELAYTIHYCYLEFNNKVNLMN